MDKIRFYVEKIDEVIAPYINKIIDFLGKGYYVIYAAIAVVIILLFIIGLFSFMKKAPKTFLFLIILLAAVGAVAFFISYKA